MPPQEYLPTLRTPFYDDLPRSFACSYEYNSTKQNYTLCGPFAQTIVSFAHYRNWQLQWDFVGNVNSSEIYEYIRLGVYNLSINGASYGPCATSHQFSYPLYWVKNCIMVPLEDELPKYWYIVWPFDRYIWLTLLFGVIYIAILMRYIRYPAQDVTRSITRNMIHSMAIVLYGSNMNVPQNNAPTKALLFYGLLFVLGFILSAYHAPYLTAYNMKPVFLPPINSVSDLLEANIEILITPNSYKEIRQHDVADVTALDRLIRQVPRPEYQDKIKEFNRDYAYLVTDYQWNFLNRQQRNLKKPYFHLSHICFGTVFKAYPIQRKAQWAAHLNEFIMKVQEAGFWLLWQEQAFSKAVSLGYASIHLDTYPVEALNLRFFTIAWIVLGSGLTVSLFSFLLEYMFKMYPYFRWGRRTPGE